MCRFFIHLPWEANLFSRISSIIRSFLCIVAARECLPSPFLARPQLGELGSPVLAASHPGCVWEGSWKVGDLGVFQTHRVLVENQFVLLSCPGTSSLWLVIFPLRGLWSSLHQQTERGSPSHTQQQICRKPCPWMQKLTWLGGRQ